jgi:hypothetical protein
MLNTVLLQINTKMFSTEHLCTSVDWRMFSSFEGGWQHEWVGQNEIRRFGSEYNLTHLPSSFISELSSFGKKHEWWLSASFTFWQGHCLFSWTWTTKLSEMIYSVTRRRILDSMWNKALQAQLWYYSWIYNSFSRFSTWTSVRDEKLPAATGAQLFRYQSIKGNIASNFYYY